MTDLTITLPGRVWDDALDPGATGMQAALDLPEPAITRVGRGWRVTYRDVPAGRVIKLADYLLDRSETMLANTDPAYEQNERRMYRAMGELAVELDLAASRAYRNENA